MISILFEPHSTSLDNAAELASGWNDVELSDLGKQQARELGKRYTNEHFDAIFCSDLQRSYLTAQLAFGNKFTIIQDKRLRECDYGDLTQSGKRLVDTEKPKRISVPFPGGESYEQTTQRMRAFLADLRKGFDGKRVMIIGHRATQYGLESILLYKPLEQVVAAPWTWQPGWHYELT